MISKLRTLLAISSILSAVGVWYVFYARISTNDAVRQANEAVDVAVALSRQAPAKSREVDALLQEATFKSERAKLTAAARETSRLYGEAAAAFKTAADKTTIAVEASDTEAERTYYSMKRDSLLKRAETAEAGQSGFALAADESIADLATLIARMEPHAVRAETARAEAKRLAAEAEAFRERHRDKF